MEEKKIKVSVVMPSLNMRQYIEESVESVINQTLKEIEIICVDAGSTDGTLEILREYEKKDDRVRVIVSDKKSCGYQMNLGVKAAKGEYIGIVETDDFILPRMYEELYTIAKDNEVDLIKAGFYRFTGEGETRETTLCRLTRQGDMYNRIIDCSAEQRAFTLMMNIWSGIYKRSYLIENNIWQNETPGAAFQDNGFWFQSLMYAKRAYFYDEPYYMNRRDNPGSSIFNKKNVYSMCDEYDFIRGIMEKNDLTDLFKFTYVQHCYFNYKETIKRIGKEDKKDFIKRFSDDFRIFQKKSWLDYRRFNEVDWNNILDIIEDPEVYYREKIEKRDMFYESLYDKEQIIVYGTGMIGGRTEHQMKYRINPIPIMSFAVTKIEGRVEKRGGVSVNEINDLVQFKDTATVIVAVTKIYQDDIKDTLLNLGFKNILISPEADIKETDYEDLKENEKEANLIRWYKRTTGEDLDLAAPKTFNEKQQWLKLNDISERKREMADKVSARDWVRKNLGEKYLIPVYGIFENVDDITLESFPKDEPVLLQLSNGTRMSIKKEKYTEWGKLLNIVPLRRFINGKMKENSAVEHGFDMVYEGIKPRIIMSKILGEYPLSNYKFLCFNGAPAYVVFDSNKFGQMDRRRDIFDMEWNRIDAEIKYMRSDVIPDKPPHFEEMKEIAKKISNGFKFCVVHLFDTEDGVLFNEVKFSFGCGVEKVTEWLDRELGEKITIL